VAGEEEKKKKKRRMRMTLPKKESDLEKVVEEVMETHPELEHEHHHHHHEDLDELLHVIDTLMDIMNTRLRDLEERCGSLAEDVKTLYKLMGALFTAIYAKSEEEKMGALKEAVKVLEKKG